jgi:hypothetical protein
VTVNVNAGSCFASGVNLGSPTAGDNCGAVTVTSNAPAQFVVGTNVVTWTATDSGGNATTCQQWVIVRDTQPPTITCPPDVIVTAASGQTNAVVNYPSPTASDNCDATPGVSCAPPSGSTFPVGVTTATCAARDAAGNSASCAFTITVTPTAGSQFGIFAGTNRFNPQTGLFEQRVTVTNTGASTVAALRLLVSGLRLGVRLYNAAGTNAGRPYVQYNASLNPTETVNLLLEFYVPDRRSFTNSFEAVAVLPAALPTNAGNGVVIDRSFVDSHVVGDPRYVIEFATIAGRSYTIIYSDDNGQTWRAATPSVTANANRIQWYDDGPPKTGSKPMSIQSRLYRVILVPASP